MIKKTLNYNKHENAFFFLVEVDGLVINYCDWHSIIGILFFWTHRELYGGFSESIALEIKLYQAYATKPNIKS